MRYPILIVMTKMLRINLYTWLNLKRLHFSKLLYRKRIHNVYCTMFAYAQMLIPSKINIIQFMP